MTDKQKTHIKPSASKGRRNKTVRYGEINYLDASSLSRPLSMPKKSYLILLAIIAVGVLIAAFAGIKISYDIVHSEDRLKAQVLEIANRGVSTDIPKLTDFVDYSDSDIVAHMSDSGCNCIDMNQVNTSSSFTVDLFKLPEDMVAEDCTTAFTNGIASLDTQNATKLLSGSWRLTVNRNAGFSYNVRFADFESETADSAIQKAMEQQGLADTKLTDNGKDGSGNTYQSGEMEIDGYHYTWTISACKLKDVYNISGLPAGSQYVGVRLNYDRNNQ